MGKSRMTSLPIEAKWSQASKDVSLESCRSAMVQETYILFPAWTGMEIFQGLSFHRFRTAVIMSMASLAATFLSRAVSHVLSGRLTMSLRRSFLAGVSVFQKWSMKVLTTAPYSDRTFLSSCLLVVVANLREHLVERIMGIEKNRGGGRRPLQKKYHGVSTTSDSRLCSRLKTP